MRTGAALALAIVTMLAVYPHDAGAQTVRYSPDITADVSGVTIPDEVVAVDDRMGTVLPSQLGGLPESVEVDAYHRLPTGDELFSLDVGAALPAPALPGPLSVERGDVVRWNGSTYALVFDASAEGLPAGVNVDAVIANGPDLLLSFDTTVALPGSLVAADEDLVRFDGTVFSMILDGSGKGLPASVDLVGADLDSAGSLLLSFDTTGEVGGWWFDDDTIMRFNGTNWTPVFDADGLHAGFVGADIVAVPEPDAWLGLASCLGLLALLGRYRRAGSGFGRSQA
jgi:hypothetical protein